MVNDQNLGVKDFEGPALIDEQIYNLQVVQSQTGPDNDTHESLCSTGGCSGNDPGEFKNI